MARAIHANSSRCHKAFIAINCAALPETLLESELFGYEDGAFTGAARGGRLGKFELAHGGTLFLDKIGDMSFAMQAKILRALQEKEIEKIGRRQAVRIDVRVIAATNRDLKYLMTQGKFRQDLYYRLDVISIHIPPLRQRPGDVAILSEHFLRQCCGKYNKRLQLSSQSIQLLHAHDWPGNVRELQNCMEYAAIMCPGGEIMPWHLPNHLHHGAAGEAPETAMADSFLPGNWRQAIRQVEYRLLQNALQSTQGNRSAAIRSLGLSRRAFYHKLKQYKLE
jgi:transcriptional regulator with PAS, ATPase and Fis domain